MPRSSMRFAVWLPLLVLLGTALTVWAETAPPIASSDTNVSGVVAEVTECKRKEGALTVKIRLHNTGEAEAKIDVIKSRNYDNWYLTAGTKKYFVLRDTEETPLAVQADSFGNLSAKIPANGSFNWWAKYPAPPADVKSVNVYTPLTPPLDDVPISDP